MDFAKRQKMSEDEPRAICKSATGEIDYCK